jgi:hypothetical protein
MDYPMAVFERPSKATSAQMELELPGGETFTREVYTIRHNRKMALTGRQENVLYTLLNDEFLQLARGHGGASMIVGSVERLRELTGNRVRMSALIDDLRALGEMRVAIRDMTRPKDEMKYAIRGSVFTLDITPEPSAWRDISATPEGKHPFVMVINDLVVFQMLKGCYERIDMEKFWSIPKPRDRHVYAWLIRNHSSIPVHTATFCCANGFVFGNSKQARYQTRRAIRASLDAVSVTGDFQKYPGASDWFIDTRRIGWTCLLKPGRKLAAFKASIPDDILQAYRRQAIKHPGLDTNKLIRQVGSAFRQAYKVGGIAAYNDEVVRYRQAVKDW